MSMFSDDERRRIIEESRRVLQRAALEREQPHDQVFDAYAPGLPSVTEVDEDMVVRALAMPTESASDRWRAEQTATEERRERQRERDERRTLEQRVAVLVERQVNAALAGIDARIAQALRAEREVCVPVIGELVGDALSEVRREAKNELADEVRELKIAAAHLETTLCELRQVVASSGISSSKIIDVPRRVN